MGAAGTTYYITADEETFSLPPNCETYRGRLNGQPYTYQGSQPGSVVFPQNPEYANAQFCEAWVYFTGLQGSGRFDNPAYSWNGTEFHLVAIAGNNPTPEFVVQPQTPLQGSDGVSLVSQGSIARDKTIIPARGSNPYMVTMLGTDITGAGVPTLIVAADDTGGAFRSNGRNGGFGYDHFDLYMGTQMQTTLNPPFPNNMVIFGCAGSPPPPASLANLKTLCPDVSRFGSPYAGEDFTLHLHRRPNTIALGTSLIDKGLAK